MSVDVLVAVLACDYGTTRHELGPHSLNRLDHALAEFKGREAVVTFVFSATSVALKIKQLQRAF